MYKLQKLKGFDLNSINLELIKTKKLYLLIQSLVLAGITNNKYLFIILSFLGFVISCLYTIDKQLKKPLVKLDKPTKEVVSLSTNNDLSPNPNWGILRLDKNIIPNDSSMEVPFILGWDGFKVIMVDLSDLIHCLVAGTSGKGKSNWINQLLQTIIYYQSEGRENIAMFLIDLKRVELINDYKYFPMCKTLHEEDEILTVLNNAIIEMNKRYSLLMDVPPGQKTHKNIKEFNAKNKTKIPHMMILFDEFADISALERSDIIWSKIQELLRKGRAAGIYLILATQRPTKENIPPIIKGLMVTFIGFGVKDESESYYCGVKGTAGMDKGYIVVNGEGYDNVKMKSFLIENDDSIYYELYNRYNINFNNQTKISLIKQEDTTHGTKDEQPTKNKDLEKLNPSPII